MIGDVLDVFVVEDCVLFEFDDDLVVVLYVERYLNVVFDGVGCVFVEWLVVLNWCFILVVLYVDCWFGSVIEDI